MGSYRGLELVVQPTDSEHRGYYEAGQAGPSGRPALRRRAGCCAAPSARPARSAPRSSWSWHPVSGKGEIYSYQIVTQAVQPAFADWVPYPVVLVELDEQRGVPWRWGQEDESGLPAGHRQPGPTATTRRCPRPRTNVAIGKRVEVCFVDLDDTMALPQFRLSDEEPEHVPWSAG